MGHIESYPTGTPVSTDRVPYVADPGGTPALKLSTVADLGGGGGTPSPFTARDFDGTSLTNLTSITGTWTAGAEFQQTDTANTNHALRLASDVSYGVVAIEGEVQFPAGAGYTGVEVTTGAAVLFSGATLAFAENTVYTIATDAAVLTTTTITAAAATWHTFKIVMMGDFWHIYLDGVHVKSQDFTGHLASNGDSGLALYSQGQVSQFRNLRLWF